MTQAVIAAVMDELGVYRPEINEDEDTRVSAYAFGTDINAGALTLTAIAAGQKVVVTNIEITPAAAGILQIQEAGTAIWRKYVPITVHASIRPPPLVMTTVGNVTITATAALTCDISIQGIKWTERSI